jgi:hypothetical protein
MFCHPPVKEPNTQTSHRSKRLVSPITLIAPTWLKGRCESDALGGVSATPGCGPRTLRAAAVFWSSHLLLSHNLNPFLGHPKNHR